MKIEFKFKTIIIVIGLTQNIREVSDGSYAELR